MTGFSRLPPLLLGCAVTLAGHAQQLPPGAPPAPFGPPRLNSPEVLPDHRVTFRISAPKADEVALALEAESREMTRDDDGVWSVTVGPLTPNIYTYSFTVDGVKTVDVNNPQVKYANTIDGSLLEMWDDEPRYDQLQDVPHGSITRHTYTASVGGVPRGLYVYVPAEYYSQQDRRYPVLFLWHGGGGSDGDWARHGRMGEILDNLIAQNKAVPMIVVAGQNVPGTPVLGARPSPDAPVNLGPGSANHEGLKQEIITDILPFLASHYRTIEDREHRAIAGLSAGGAVGIVVGLSSLDLFAHVGEFSTGWFGGVGGYTEYDLEAVSPGFFDDIDATNAKLHTLFMSCGTEDPRFPFQQKAAQDLQEKGIDVTFAGYEGQHEWKVFRAGLRDFAQKIFK